MTPQRVSRMAAGMTPSTILKMAAEVRALVAEGRQVRNLTVGDFDPTYFPIPSGLREGIETALKFGQTVYPPPMGVPALREAIQIYSRVGLGLEYPVEGVLVTSGVRPAIYGAFRTLVDPGEGVLYSLPCWQYGNYCQLVGARPMPIPCDASTRFLPTRSMLEPLVQQARLLVLNSPNNPTGTMFDPDVLAGIADLVLEENARRGDRERPLYLLYDQVYWTLTYGDAKHVTPVAVRPALVPYTVSVDAISKAFAATGLRVGWALGPNDVIRAMGDYLADVGTWAPRPEQVATAMFLSAPDAVAAYRAARTPRRPARRTAGDRHRVLSSGGRHLSQRPIRDPRSHERRDPRHAAARSRFRRRAVPGIRRAGRHRMVPLIGRRGHRGDDRERAPESRRRRRAATA
jgi:aspartate aminotransferase